MAWKSIEDQRAYFARRYAANVAYMQAYKLEHGCADCGYDEHHAGLEFDHIMPRLRGTVGNQVGKSMKIMIEEMERCEVVCGTCHNIRTYERSRPAPVE